MTYSCLCLVVQLGIYAYIVYRLFHVCLLREKKTKITSIYIYLCSLSLTLHHFSDLLPFFFFRLWIFYPNDSWSLYTTTIVTCCCDQHVSRKEQMRKLMSINHSVNSFFALHTYIETDSPHWLSTFCMQFVCVCTFFFLVIDI